MQKLIFAALCFLPCAAEAGPATGKQKQPELKYFSRNQNCTHFFDMVKPRPRCTTCTTTTLTEDIVGHRNLLKIDDLNHRAVTLLGQGVPLLRKFREECQKLAAEDAIRQDKTQNQRFGGAGSALSAHGQKIDRLVKEMYAAYNKKPHLYTQLRTAASRRPPSGPECYKVVDGASTTHIQYGERFGNRVKDACDKTVSDADFNEHLRVLQQLGATGDQKQAQ